MRSICAACWQRDCKQCWEEKPPGRRASECFSYDVRCKWKLKCFGIRYLFFATAPAFVFSEYFVVFFFSVWYSSVFYRTNTSRNTEQLTVIQSASKWSVAAYLLSETDELHVENHSTTTLSLHEPTRRQKFKSEACFVSLNQDRLQIRLPSTLSSLLLFKIWVALTSTAT